ncbi:MAG TPA: alpha/beta fold hydrolase [Chloroflexota bacterium]|nr:alpha/beta fold hydrolase [Chloroflexota bacterium]
MATQAWQDGWVVVPQVAGMRDTVYGVRTHYVQAGAGEPVVLVHGGGPGAGGASGWSNTIPALAERFRVYAIDLIGAGLTDKPPIEYSFQTQVNHLAGFIDALNLHDVRLVGNSQGAYVAIKYALDFPARVKQAALISTATLATACGLSDEGKAAPLPRFDGTRDSIRAFLEVIVNDPARITDDLLDARFAAASLPGHREMMQSLGRYRELLANDPSERQVYDVRARLPLLTIPWCMIWGGADRSAPLDPLGKGLHAMFPDVPFHVVEGSGHQVQNDKPEECNRLLREFFGVAVPQTAGA